MAGRGTLMTEETAVKQQAIASYIGKALQKHFGKGPTSVYVTFEPPFLTMSIRGFLMPFERILLSQKKEEQVEQTRELLMQEFFLAVRLQLEHETEHQISEFYFDWNLIQKTGMLWCILDTKTPYKHSFSWPEEIDQQLFEKKVNHFSTRGQKEPDEINTFWLNNRTVLIERIGVFVEIEKALIQKGFKEELKIAKRPLERQLVREEHFEEILFQKITDIFTDWDFTQDKGYMVLTLVR